MSTYTARKKEALRRGISNIKLLSTSALVAAGTLALGTGMAHADNWVDLTTTSGSTTTDLSQENTTNIGINSGKAIVEGDLDINAGWTVNVGTGDLVAIDRENDATFIYGRLNCAGSCHVLDGDGIIVGDTGAVDSRSVTFGTGELLNPQGFMETGKLELGNFGPGSIEINGVVNVAEAGLAAFVSPTITNNGIINAKMGTVAMAAGETVTLDLYGDGLVEITVDGELADALIENKGTIAAEGGTVQVTALAAKSAVDNIINVEGVVTVASATQAGGKIVLSGGSKGTVSVSGNVDAAGTDGGDVSITGENVHVTDSAYINVDGGRGSDGQGGGGTVNIYGDKYAVLEGKLFGRGGENGGNGGNAELSAGDSVGFNGIVDLSATNGEVGTFVIDPAHLYINDTYEFWGFDYGPIGTLTVYDQAVANSLANNDVKLWATETLSTGTDIDISQYSYDELETPGYWTPGYWGGFSVGWVSGYWTDPVYNTVTELTTHDLQLAAPQVNLIHDITLGEGSLNVADILDGDSVLGFGLITPWTDIIVDELNLDGKIYRRLAPLGGTDLALDSQINTTADTINVLSSDASIQQAVHFADALDGDQETINVDNGNYAEDVIIDRNVKLLSVNGRDVTTITGQNTKLGAVLFTGASDNAQLGDIDKGFTVIGNNGNGAIENAAVYLQGPHSGNQIIGNELVANGDSALTSEWSALVDGLVVDGNIFSGQTFVGANPSGIGSSTQFDVGNNVPRQLVTIGGGGNTTNVTFTNNELTGTTGGISTDDNVSSQGNFLATIASAGSTITGNSLTGTTTRNGALRVRGSDATVSNNTVTNVGGAYGIIFDNVSTLLAEDNTVTGAESIGMYVNGGSNVNLTNNQVHDSNYGIVVNNVDGTDAANPGVQLISNDVFGGGTAITVTDSDFAKLWHNNVSGQTANGIVVSGGTDANLRFNWARFLGGTGITVSNNANALVDDSTVKGTGADGILVNSSNGAKVTGNNVTETGGYGIRVNNSNNAVIGTAAATDRNTVTTATLDGIKVSGGTGVTIENNKVEDAARVGIYAEHAVGLKVLGNDVNNTTYAIGLPYGGITTDWGSDITISGNTVTNSGHGVMMYLTGGTNTVSGNHIDNVTHNGVNANQVSGLTVSGNFIGKNTGNIGGAGIYGTNLTGTTVIDNNEVEDTFDEGIALYGFATANITNNKVENTGWDGIYTDGENAGGSTVNITGNTVNTAAGAGILVGQTDHVTISLNTTKKTDVDGIGVEYSGVVNIDGNTVSKTGAAGIYTGYNDVAHISGNTISEVGYYNPQVISYFGDGIVVEETPGVGGDYATVTGNTIDKTEGNGITIVNAPSATVDGNFIGTNDGDIDGNGVEVQTSNNAVITDNEINDTGSNGIFVNASDDVEIGGASSGLGNTVTQAGAHGILVTGGEDALIQYNNVLGTDTTTTWGSFFGIPFPNGANDGVAGAQLNGIHVEDNGGVDILNNTIAAGQTSLVDLAFGASGGNGANGNGVFVSGSNNAVIDQNTVSGDLLGSGVGAGQNGIHVEGSNLLTVGGLIPVLNGNKIFSTGNDGIHIDGSFGALVLNNIIGGVPLMNVADDGIDLNNTIGTLVAGNIITDVGDDGIAVTDSLLSAIALNAINGAGDDGIDINSSGLMLVALNQIGGADENGIQANGTFGLALAGNVITDAGEDGIHADNGILSIISGNEISGSDDDGIDVSNQLLASINGNRVDESGDNGIQADNLLFASIADNVVTDSDQDGITVGSSALVSIADNVVVGSGDDGIDVDDSAIVSVLNNLVAFSGDDGIEFDSSIFGTIDGNATLFSADNGIEIEDSAFVQVTDNFTAFSGNAGIYVDPSFFVNVSGNTAIFNTVGIEFDEAYFSTINNNNVAFNLVGISVEDSAFIDVSNNNVAFNLLGVHVGDTAFATVNNNSIFFNLLGVNVQDSAFIDVSENTIASNLIGVRLEDVAAVNVEGNDIYNNLFMGLWADGANNGYIRLAGNTFTDNMIGARLESGDIDLSDTANPNSFIFTPGYTAPLGAPVVGMQFDSANPTDPNTLTIVDNTLGTTQFQGFISRPVGDAYYVRIEDDTLLDAGGDPVVIDGTFASWDGLVPDSFGNVLPANVLQALEDRLFDADDSPVDGRGQIFVGDASQTLENIEDFFNQFSPFDGGATGLNVTLLGMPYTGIGAFNLANIAPAAGGDDQSPESLADIEPAAGGEEAACWGDALNAAAGGKAANFSFGGSFEESLADASSCGS